MIKKKKSQKIIYFIIPLLIIVSILATFYYQEYRYKKRYNTVAEAYPPSSDLHNKLKDNDDKAISLNIEGIGEDASLSLWQPLTMSLKGYITVFSVSESQEYSTTEKLFFVDDNLKTNLKQVLEIKDSFFTRVIYIPRDADRDGAYVVQVAGLGPHGMILLNGDGEIITSSVEKENGMDVEWRLGFEEYDYNKKIIKAEAIFTNSFFSNKWEGERRVKVEIDPATGKIINTESEDIFK